MKISKYQISKILNISKTTARRFEGDHFLKGFSLIEMVVVIGIMGLALSAYAASIAAIPLLRNVRFTNLATDIAVKRMEEIKTFPWDTITGSGTMTDSTLTALPKGAGVWEITVREVNLKEVMVRVQWEEPGQSKLKRFELRTYVTKGGT